MLKIECWVHTAFKTCYISGGRCVRISLFDISELQGIIQVTKIMCRKRKIRTKI